MAAELLCLFVIDHSLVKARVGLPDVGQGM